MNFCNSPLANNLSLTKGKNMPVRIRLSRFGTKKRPSYRIVVADSRRSRDGKFIDRIGTYNPMLPKEHPERIKIDAEKAKEWIKNGAQPSNRVHLFLSNVGVLKKPLITEKTKKHLPRKKTQERMAALKEVKEGTDKGEKKNNTADEIKASEEAGSDTAPAETTSAKDANASREIKKQKSKDSSVEAKSNNSNKSK